MRWASAAAGTNTSGVRTVTVSPARYAQYTNFEATPDVFARKSQILAEHCKDVGTDFDAIVRSVVAREEVVGASVLVAHDGKILLHKGYGFADRLKAENRVRRGGSRPSGTVPAGAGYRAGRR